MAERSEVKKVKIDVDGLNVYIKRTNRAVTLTIECARERTAQDVFAEMDKAMRSGLFRLSLSLSPTVDAGVQEGREIEI